MLSERHRKRTVGWIAGISLAAMAVGVTGCSNDTDSTVKKKPAAGSSKVADSNKRQQQKGGSAASQSSVARQPTPEGAVAAWVTAVIKGQPREACLLMGEPATGSTPARAGTPTTCDGDTPEMRELRDNIGRFTTAFAPELPTEDPKVEVAAVPVTGDKTVIPAAKVTVDGQPLDKVILSRSTGVEAGQLDVKVESTRIDDAWYVTNLDLNVG
ncbi:hypothetical protein QF026_000598 [Streptomyces aurantiacus]|uniref:hypothetical protein n=1 Tax=Streptomyces aurantiacus TaxID=47760 RepID=UPI0027909200|nr:hypothetical protein [Streptomyces aurantiacus]MDQ0772132.1 hypothetical protein [Streptomyces aurantiacus]